MYLEKYILHNMKKKLKYNFPTSLSPILPQIMRYIALVGLVILVLTLCIGGVYAESLDIVGNGGVHDTKINSTSLISPDSLVGKILDVFFIRTTPIF